MNSLRTLTLVQLAVSLLWILTVDSHALAQCQKWGQCSRGTLFHWGDGFTGGPDLSEPLVTDRPDFTEASSTVGYHVAQIELGYTYEFDNDNGTQTISHSYPEPLLRLGVLANWLEFRLAGNYVNRETNGNGVFGDEDLYLGFKIGLTPQQGVLPEMALIPQMTVDSGDPDFTNNETLVGANWIYAWDVGDNFSFAGSTQVNQAIDGTGDDYSEWAQSATVGVSLTDYLGGYAEWFALMPHQAVAANTEHYFNGGFTVLLTDDVLWDIRAGVGLSEASTDYFVGTGLSIRFR